MRQPSKEKSHLDDRAFESESAATAVRAPEVSWTVLPDGLRPLLGNARTDSGAMALMGQ